ncbi:MAG: RlmE family RNA methyltransferase [Asgard group archaeon]|nr:RlmE family RNA methyltransferase [Asgard group archaeon]
MSHRRDTRKKEYYYKEAKKAGYRSRASYKLIQIQKKFNIFKAGDNVIDIGAAPGGWSQIASEFIKPGRVYAVDLEYIEPLDGVLAIQGDITDPKTLERVKTLVNDPVDTVICDISPKVSGNWSTDHARQIYLSELALKFTISGILKQGGKFVCKLFQGDLIEDYISNLKKLFTVVYLFKPKASRSRSAEVYTISKGLKKGPIKWKKTSEGKQEEGQKDD